MENEIDTIVRFSPLDIPKIIRAHWGANPKEPVHFIGEPSTVKSASVLQESKRLAELGGREFIEWNRISLKRKQEVMENPQRYFVFADLRASETDIGELRLQDLRGDVNYISFKYNILFETLSHPEAVGILFFDEMNLAPNMIKAQFYKIINDHAVGDIPISEGVLCVSAGNEAEHSRGVTEDPVPLVLRRGNYFIRPLTADEYVEYAVSTGHHQWIIGYLGFQPADVHKIEYDIPDSVGQPCARTWTKLSNILNNGLDEQPIEDIEMIATGLVGQATAAKFTAFVKAAKKISIAEVIKHPERVKEYEKDEELSIIYAIISGVVEKFKKDKKVMKSAFEMTLHFERPEFGAYLLRVLKAADENAFKKAVIDEKIIDKKIVERVVDKYGKYLFVE